MSGIHLRAPVFVLFFLIRINPLKVSIDGAPEVSANWDGHQFPLAPGQHHLRVSILYFWFLPIGKAELVVDVPPGQVVGVEYKHPWIVFMAGKLRVLGAQPVAGGMPAQPAAAAAVPASWLPDPAGRHEQRYWDGSRWTEHVSTGGTASVDPI